LWYTTSQDFSLARYTESDFAISINDKKNTSDCAFHLETNLISWESKKQSIVAISSAKVEYVIATSTSCQVVWLRKLLNDLDHIEKESTPIFCDNNSTIAFSKNHVFHKKIKHIDT